MTKVLHIITRLISGGADENTVFTCEGLDPEKYKVDLVVGSQSELYNFPDLKNTTIIELDSLVRNIHPLKDIKTFFALVKLMRTQRYDIIHTHTAKAGILGRAAARWTKAPVVIHSLHGSTFHEAISKLNSFIYKMLEKITMRWTTKVISVGNDLKQRYLDAGVGKPDQYVTIRSGFDLSQFLMDDNEMAHQRKVLLKELRLLNKAVLIGSATRLEARKGHTYLLSAMKQIIQEHKNVHLVIAGDGALEAQLKERVEQDGLSEHVHFLGFRKDIHNVMAAFDIFVLSSLWEGLPRVLVQAAALQKPILTFHVEGASEIVDSGVNGYIVPLKDVDQLTARLNDMLKNMHATRKMGEHSRTKINNDWDKDVMVAQITSLYEELLS
jgi:glycosyltransferase involved in cell wall biosynthesis